MKSLLPHEKLDWTISRLEGRLQAAPHDPAVQLELARVLLSRGLFHADRSGSGEQACHRALALVRKVLKDDPANVAASVTAGLALVGLHRVRSAERHLDQALHLDAERADLHLALGWLASAKGDLPTAVRHLETACRLAPRTWEPHLGLGRALFELAGQRGYTRRLVERAQYHMVRALKLDPPPDQHPALLKDLGVTCMMTGRLYEAEKFFIRLREHERYRSVARFHLGQVAYELGKYNNAIQHFRQYLRDRPDDADVLARMAMARFQLGEYPRAREACHQALLADPGNVVARYALGCTLLEEGEPNQAVRVFRETLREHPDHLPTYIELARTHRRAGDTGWLVKALQVETSRYDRLPWGGEVDARWHTRNRVAAILDELRAVGPSTTGTILRTIPQTQDEGLRFQLWETACMLATSAVADDTALRLHEPGRCFGPEIAGNALAAASALPEPVLTRGLDVKAEDIKRAAVDRHGPASDVEAYRANIEVETARARAHQALLLLAIASRRSSSGRALLREWAATADSELATAAWAALALYGDPEAARQLGALAGDTAAAGAVNRLLASVTPPSTGASSAEPQPLTGSAAGQTRCDACGRTADQVTYLMAGTRAVLCDRCVLRVWQHRRSLIAPDDADCRLCGRTPFEADGLYRLDGIDVCSHCIQLSLGLLEREEVDRFLAEW